MKFLKWFYPGLRVKRWFLVSFFGFLLSGAAFAILNHGEVFAYLEIRIRELTYHVTGQAMPWLVPGGLAVLAVGIFLLVWGFNRMIRSLIEVVLPGPGNKLVDVVYQKRHLERGPKVVVIGGGTGLSVLLRGLKHYTSNITAIVTVSDDGGSSGRLRGELGILPPGDIRNCMVALADTESAMEEMFNYRFGQGSGLAGHSLGNLFLAAMTDLAGNLDKAVQEMSRVLAIRGKILPSTLENVTLCARLKDGTVLEGETSVSQAVSPIEEVFLKPQGCRPLPGALKAIEEADLVILGPGSLYTSVIPNLLMEGIPEALRATKALRVYVCNVMTQPGETEHYTASDHLAAILRHGGTRLVDYMLVNGEEIPRSLLKKYKEQGAAPVKADAKTVEAMGVSLARARIIDSKEVVRHDPEKLAGSVIRLLFRVKPNDRTGLIDFLLLTKKLAERGKQRVRGRKMGEKV